VCSDPDWALKFVIRWQQLSPSVLSLLKANKRLSPSHKNTVIKFLVDEMKKCCPNPDFSQSRIIARQVVAAYPMSFEDRTDDLVMAITPSLRKSKPGLNTQTEENWKQGCDR